MKRREEKKKHGKKQVATVAVESCFKEQYRRDFFKNLYMVKLYKVSNLVKISPSKMHDMLGTMIN